MTIHFHTKHFISTNLDLIEYMMLLMYENSNLSVKEMQQNLKMSERSVIRIRKNLIEKGYLIKIGKSTKNKYQLTDKMYPKH